MIRKIKCLLFLLLAGGMFSLSAQVIIGNYTTADKAKLLQIGDAGGVVFSRVQLISLTSLEPFIPTAEQTETVKREHTGLMVYNLTTTAGFAEGIYTWDGAKWTDTDTGGNQWFYMPAFNLPMQTLGTTTFDLYAEYQSQITKLGSDFLYAKGELDYVVVYYDAAAVTVTGIDTDGVMTYEVLDTDPPPTAFMTVVLVVK